MAPLRLLSALLLLACGSAPAQVAAPARTGYSKPALRAELLKMSDVDQAARHAAIDAGFKDPALNERMTEVDKVHTRRLHAIVDDVGWPTTTMVGEDGATAAWLLVQHADLDVDFQERCLKLMEPLAAAGEASKRDLAYLTDRVAVNRGRPQRYGTQWNEVNGEYVPQPIEDPERVDERRAAAGLDTLAQNKARMIENYKPKPASR